MLDFKWYYLILIELLIYFKNIFICGLAYLVTRHKKEYIFWNRNFSEIILQVYNSDEESVSSDSSNDHCNSLDSAYLPFIEFSLNRTGCRGELQRTVLRISLRAVLSRSQSHSAKYFKFYRMSSHTVKTFDWSRVHKELDIPTFKPSASRNHKLDPDLYVPGETRRKKLAEKEKMKPEDQKCFAANKPRQSFKYLPDGWTRDTVGIWKICALF